MKKRLVGLVLSITLLALTATGCSGCASSWWQNFQQNPVAQVQLFETGVQTTLSTAEAVWADVTPFLPADVLAKAQPIYNDAVVTVNDSLAALNDALTAAAAAGTPNPDFSTLIKAVEDAVAKVIAIIDQYKGTPAPAMATASKPASPRGYDKLQTHFAAMKKLEPKKALVN
jgi:hypothetical protein